MNAVKFVPTNSNGQTNLTALASYGSYNGSINMSLTIQSSFIPPVYTLPYTASSSCDNYYGKLTSAGVDTSSISYPYSSLYYTYTVASPVRPMCKTASGTSGSSIEFGDVLVSPSDSNPITVHGAYAMTSSMKIPSGFTPLLFSGSASKDGYVENVLSITASSNVTILTPQVNLNFVSKISSTANIGALVYSKITGLSYYLPSSRWNQDQTKPYRAGFVLPSDGVYIFGSLDNSINSILPALFSQTMSFLGSWGTKSFEFSSSASASSLLVNFTSSLDFYFLVNPYSPISDASTAVLGAWNIGFTGTPKVQLSFPNTTGYVWA
jgi:hypothetical protein